MISLKKYLDASQTQAAEPVEQELLPAALAAYRSGLLEMGSSSVDACPALGEELKRSLAQHAAKLNCAMTPARSRILLVNPAVALKGRLRKINHLGPSTWARNPPKMAYSWRV